MKSILLSTILLVPVLLTGCVSAGAGVGPGGVGAGVSVGVDCPNPAPHQHHCTPNGGGSQVTKGTSQVAAGDKTDTHQQVAQN